MGVSVIRDNPENSDNPSSPPPAATADREPGARAVRRFTFDPTSSPVLGAALAWDTATSRS